MASTSTEKAPFAVRSAASSFSKHRAEYYKYLASMLEASKGNTKFSTLFDRDAQRYAGKPKGVLCAYWCDRYMNNGGNLGDAWEGTLPDDEIAIVRVAQDAGADAILYALKDMARVAALADKIKSEVMGTMMAAIIGLAIGVVMLTVFPIFSSKKLQEIYSFIPLDQWGPKGTAFNQHAQRVIDYGGYWVIGFGMVVAYLFWTIENLTGPVRDWLDRKVVLYRAIRDIKGALFLSTMSTLTRRRGNVMFTLQESLTAFAQNARSAWLRWRVEQIIEGIDQTGAIGTEAFNTPLLSQEMYFYMRDTQEALGFADGFVETGKYVESTILEGIIKRMTVYRWLLLLVGVMSVVLVMGWQFSIIYEMKGVMQNYYSSK
jgi:type II secretory pathway component PulF